MAQYKVGNKLLDEGEYEGEIIMIWGFWLFVIGALIAGMYVHSMLPAEWSKEWRFASVIAGGAFSGGVLAYFAPYVRAAFFMGLFALTVSGALYWVWTHV